VTRGDRRRRGIEADELGELAEEGEVGRAGSATEDEGMSCQEGVEGHEEAAVAVLDDGRRRGVRADDSEPTDLSLGEELGELRDGGVVCIDGGPAGQHLRGLLHVGVVGPAVVEHRLREPLVAVVLDERVDEGHDRIRRHHLATRHPLLQLAQLEGGVDHGAVCAAPLAGEDENGDEGNGNVRGIAVLLRVPDDELEGNAPVAQQGAHLARVGRAGRTDEAQGRGHREPPGTVERCILAHGVSLCNDRATALPRVA
jgi:hypothetical protein